MLTWSGYYGTTGRIRSVTGLESKKNNYVRNFAVQVGSQGLVYGQPWLDVVKYFREIIREIFFATLYVRATCPFEKSTKDISKSFQNTIVRCRSVCVFLFT